MIYCTNAVIPISIKEGFCWAKSEAPLNQSRSIIKSLIFISALSFGGMCQAYVDRTIVIRGVLKDFDGEIARVQTETGMVKIPSNEVKSMHYQSGQPVMIFVDIADFLSLNKDAIAKLESASSQTLKTK